MNKWIVYFLFFFKQKQKKKKNQPLENSKL